MGEMMKAAVYEGIDKMTVKSVEKPTCDENGVLLKVHACAICGSDIRIFHSGNSRVHPPQILGHEIAGEVVEAGSNVTKFSVGDRVAVGADVPCGECVFCEAGIGNNCQINYAMGYQFAGGFAEYMLLNKTVVNYGPVHKIPEHITYNEAALAEPLACVINALELSRIELGDTVVIIGAGPIGCMIIPVAYMLGATKVIVVQRSKPRMEVAKKFNADTYICSSEENMIERVLEETGGLGADVVITANPNPQTQADALHMAKNRGRINLFGGLPKDKSLVTMDNNIIHYKELFVHGAHGSMPRHHQKAMDLISSGKLDMKAFLSDTYPLEGILDGIAAAEAHTGMRVVVNP